jgi:hypothetical protein
MPACEKAVPLYDFGDGHVARCFLYDETASAIAGSATGGTTAAVSE